jgi:hypothetical protein
MLHDGDMCTIEITHNHQKDSDFNSDFGWLEKLKM